MSQPPQTAGRVFSVLKTRPDCLVCTEVCVVVPDTIVYDFVNASAVVTCKLIVNN